MAQDPEEVRKTSTTSPRISISAKRKFYEFLGIELPVVATEQDETNPSSSTTVKDQENKEMSEKKEKKKKKKGEEMEVKNKTDEEKKEVVPAVGFMELFRFADRLDYILMVIGSVGAFVHGSALPLFLRFFADLVNSFGANVNNPEKMTNEVVKVFLFLVILFFKVGCS